jgi:hypothetical protein
MQAEWLHAGDAGQATAVHGISPCGYVLGIVVGWICNRSLPPEKALEVAANLSHHHRCFSSTHQDGHRATGIRIIGVGDRQDG